MNKRYAYGMKERGVGPGCQPKDGFVDWADDYTETYYTILYYDRALTDEEIGHYALEYLGDIDV